MSHLIEMSNITTRANNQFPRPDFHRLDKQPYRLQPLVKGEYFKDDPSPGVVKATRRPSRINSSLASPANSQTN